MSIHLLGQRSFTRVPAPADPISWTHHVAKGTELIIIGIATRTAINSVTVGGNGTNQLILSGGAGPHQAALYGIDNTIYQMSGPVTITVDLTGTSSNPTAAGAINLIGADMSSYLRSSSASGHSGTSYEYYMTNVVANDLVVEMLMTTGFANVSSSWEEQMQFNSVDSSLGAVLSTKKGDSMVRMAADGFGAAGGFENRATAVLRARAIPAGQPIGLGCMLYNNSDVVNGILPEITNLEIEDAINELSLATFIVPKTENTINTMIASQTIRIRHSEDGFIFLGKVVRIEEAQDDSGTDVYKVTAMSIGVELTKVGTNTGVVLKSDTLATAIPKLFVNSTNWSYAALGGGFVPMSQRLDFIQNWQALLEIAAAQNCIIREAQGSRSIEFVQVARSTGITLINHENCDFTNPFIGTLIKRNTRITEDVINRVIPQALNAGNIWLDLKQSNRTLPYTIQNMVRNKPTITNSIISAKEILARENRVTLGDLEVTGSNRAVFIYIGTNGGLPGDVSDAFVVNGTVGKERWATSPAFGGQELHAVALALNVPAGLTRLTLELPNSIAGSGGSSSVFIWYAAFALQDVSQEYGDTFMATQTGSSGAFQSSGSTGSFTLTNCLKLGCLFTGSTHTITSRGSGQINEQSYDRITVDSSVQDTQDFTWNFSTTEEWAALGFVIRGARTYYIEDATSIATYGLSEETILDRATRFIGAGSLKTDAANTLYDKYSAYLTNRKDPPISEEFEVGYLPGSSLDWFVGDSFHIEYRDIYGTATSGTRYCLGRKQTYDENNARRWTLTLSTTFKVPKGADDFFSDQIERILNLESAGTV